MVGLQAVGASVGRRSRKEQRLTCLATLVAMAARKRSRQTMRSIPIVAAAVWLALRALSLPTADAATPVDNFGDLSQAILACWRPPAGSEGSEITLRFGLTGRGELRGPPMVTYSRL